MRFALAILVLALIFSGYTTAAHAFEGMQCEQGSFGKTDNSNAKCHDFQKLSSDDHHQKSDKNGKVSCVDCHHCCATSAVTVLNGVLAAPLYNDVLMSASHDSRDGSIAAQLRRPPKSLA